MFSYSKRQKHQINFLTEACKHLYAIFYNFLNIKYKQIKIKIHFLQLQQFKPLAWFDYCFNLRKRERERDGKSDRKNAVNTYQCLYLHRRRQCKRSNKQEDSNTTDALNSAGKACGHLTPQKRNIFLSIFNISTVPKLACMRVSNRISTQEEKAQL